MKKVALGLVIFACLFIPVDTTSAHVLVMDDTNTKGAIVHIIPDDDPVAGERSTIYFDMQNQASDAKYAVKLFVKNVNGSESDIEMKVDGTLATGEYTFPSQGLFNLTFTVTTQDENFIFQHDQRVSRGVTLAALEKPSYAWAQIILIASGISFALLLITAINRRKDISKYSSF